MPYAVCRMPYAVCRHYNKKPAWRHITIVLYFILVIFVSSGTQAAELSSCINPHQTVTPGAQILVATPADFDNMPVGSLVSHVARQGHNFVYAAWDCTVAHQMNGIGYGYLQTPGVTVVPGVSVLLDDVSSYDYPSRQYGSILSSDVFTTPELQARGLGYILGAYLNIWSCDLNGTSNHDDHQTAAPAPPYYPSSSLPDLWRDKPACLNEPARYLYLHIIFGLVKIGDASQHGTLPQNFTTPIATFYIANQSNPSLAIASASFSIYATNFSSRVQQRTCTTPSASESTIYFSTIYENEVSNKPPGTQLAVRDFTITFNCPFSSYYNIGFWVEPVYGLIASNNNAAGNHGTLPYSLGTMKIASGAGMAEGVGIQLSVISPNGSVRDPPNVIVSPSEQNHMRILYGENHFYNIFPILTHGWTDADAPTWGIQRKFRAKLIRLDGPLTAGQIKAAAIIHIRYN